MSKGLFELMRVEQLEAEFPTKKMIQVQSSNMVSKVLEDGNHNPVELLSQAVRATEALTTITNKLKASLPNENFEAFGLKGVYAEGGSTLNYEDDLTYCDILAKLNARKMLLDLANKVQEPFYDSEGVEVPKVSSTPRKGSLRVTF